MEAVTVAEQAVDEVIRSKYELECGKPMPGFNHSIIQARISQQLLNGYEDQYTVASELSLDVTTPPTVPDLCIYPETPVNWKQDEVKVSRVPLTVIEIMSPSQTVTELNDKAKLLFAVGVQSYWLVMTTFRTVTLLQPNTDELVFYNDVLTDPTNGISIDLKKVFR